MHSQGRVALAKPGIAAGTGDLLALRGVAAQVIYFDNMCYVKCAVTSHTTEYREDSVAVANFWHTRHACRNLAMNDGNRACHSKGQSF